eukprot:scaffold58681_cov69-Phaeocystis_antarctica.AAC.2
MCPDLRRGASSQCAPALAARDRSRSYGPRGADRRTLYIMISSHTYQRQHVTHVLVTHALTHRVDRRLPFQTNTCPPTVGLLTNCCTVCQQGVAPGGRQTARVRCGLAASSMWPRERLRSWPSTGARQALQCPFFRALLELGSR